jgi:hypothetical protein
VDINIQKYGPTSLMAPISIVAILCASCMTGTPHYISQRDPAPAPAIVQEISAVEPKEQKPLDLFVRQKDVKIRRKAPSNETGSLTDLNDPRAYLFGFERPVEVGMFVDVKIASNRSDGQSAGAESGATEKPADPNAANTGAAGQESKDVAAEALLKALPSLDPAPQNKPILLKSIKMQVLERFENGDVLVMHRRRSIREGQGADVTVTSRLPAEALARLDNISTSDLADVDWRESFNGEIAERKSANWEDEYSLRLSGFDETKSKDALSIDEKREQLKSARDKLESEMKGFVGERSRMSAERSKLLENKAKDDAKITELEKKNSELEKKLEEMKPKEPVKLTGDVAKADGKKADASKTDAKPKEAAPATKPAAAKPAKVDAKKDSAKPAAKKQG